MKKQQRPVVLTTTLFALVGCAGSPGAPEPASAPVDVTTRAQTATDPLSGDDARFAVHDALSRVLPALAEGNETALLRAALLRVVERLDTEDAAGLQRTVSNATDALARYQRYAGEAFEPDIDAIRLGLDAIALSLEDVPRDRVR